MAKIKVFTFLVFILALTISVSALPVTFDGTIAVDGNSGVNIPVEIKTQSQEYNNTFNESYMVSLAGQEGTNTSFYIYGVEIKTIPQPIQASFKTVDLTFTDENRLGEALACEYSQACLSKNCNENHCCPIEEVWCSEYNECRVSCRRTSSGGGGYVKPKLVNVTNETNITEVKEPIQEIEENKTTFLSRAANLTGETVSRITGQAVGVVSENKVSSGGVFAVLGLLAILGLYARGNIGSKVHRARKMHKRAQKAHLKGNYNKSTKLYSKARRLRESSFNGKR